MHRSVPFWMLFLVVFRTQDKCGACEKIDLRGSSVPWIFKVNFAVGKSWTLNSLYRPLEKFSNVCTSAWHRRASQANGPMSRALWPNEFVIAVLTSNNLLFKWLLEIIHKCLGIGMHLIGPTAIPSPSVVRVHLNTECNASTMSAEPMNIVCIRLKAKEFPIEHRIQIEFRVRILNLVRRLCHELFGVCEINIDFIVVGCARVNLSNAANYCRLTICRSKLIRLSVQYDTILHFVREIGRRCRGDFGEFVASATLADGQQKLSDIFLEFYKRETDRFSLC